MSIPIVQKTLFLLSEETFTSLDEKICQIIYEGNSENFESYLKNGLDPNYFLKEDIKLEDTVFLKNSPLIFLIIQCCIIASYPWDHWAILRILLEKNVDLERQIEHGGGVCKCFRVCL